MEKYISLLNPNKVKKDFIFSLFLLFSPENNKEISLRNWNCIHLYNGHNITYNDLQKGRKVILQNEDGTNRECTKFHEILNITETQYALIDKVESMLNKGAGLKDVVIMLNSFSSGTKRLKSCGKDDYKHEKQYEWTIKNGNEKLSHKGNLPKAHFRWDFGERYTLTTEDLEKISLFVKPLVKHL